MITRSKGLVNLHDRTYLVMGAAAPVCDEDYQILGILYGGVVINETDAIVRKINDEILQNEKYDGIDIGMALIAGWDREVFTDICSNERLQHSETVMLRKIYETILKNEKSWIGSVYFHERRYIAAYDPIKDIEGRIIGILGINLLAKPYIDVIIKHTVGWILIGACAVSLLTVIAFFLTTKIVRPIRTIVEATRKISQGDLDVHVDVGASDELSLLAGSFNEMVSRLKSARDRFEYRGKSLEEQVKERTREIEKIQSKIFQQEKLAIVGQLASSIAHEIGTPLNIVLGNAEYLVSEMDKDDPKMEELRDIIEQTEKITERVKQLLSMARPRRAIMEKTNVNQVLEKVLSILNPVIIKSSVTLVKDLACNIPNIIADSSQLEQVFINLIINSMDAMAGKGELKVMTSYVGDEQEERPVTVTFSDTGCGIPEHCITKIFDPFFTTKPYGYGTGLGLTVTYHIVEAHGGTIDVESEEEVGTTFIIKLPVSNVQLN
ncbi:MAG: ATP-binding protein [Thermodesulfobacteriota bacterium]|nr:ATP-binding protein [Thermodesulfobacteriota bacterium]